MSVNNVKLKISNLWIRKCEEFADQQLKDSYNLYKHRGEQRIEKMRDDIIVGKLVELAAYKFLKPMFTNLSKPDFTIYERKNKSFSADLYTKAVSFHVKGQSEQSRKKYGSSFLFQKTDPVIRTPEPNHFIIVGVVDEEKLFVTLLGCISAANMKQYIKEPKNPTYALTKVAVYVDDFDPEYFNLNEVFYGK